MNDNFAHNLHAAEITLKLPWKAFIDLAAAAAAAAGRKSHGQRTVEGTCPEEEIQNSAPA